MGIVNNQLENGKPVETQQTYDRLIDEGYSDDEARNLIGHVVVREIYDMIEEEKSFNLKRFISGLEKLPELPGE